MPLLCAPSKAAEPHLYAFPESQKSKGMPYLHGENIPQNGAMAEKSILLDTASPNSLLGRVFTILFLPDWVGQADVTGLLSVKCPCLIDHLEIPTVSDIA